MSLRIRKPLEGALRGRRDEDVDHWGSRLAKLIPAEALGLYGVGQALIPKGRTDGLWVLAGGCLIVSAWLRWVATRDDDGQPQLLAVGIALVSFTLWVAALKPPTGPIDLGANAVYIPLAAMVWAIVMPSLYKGD
jgi:hypothetical protein